MRLVRHFLNYSRMIKLSHSLFALPFAGLAAILAFLESDLLLEDVIFLGLLIVICVISARSAAMGFNRYVDAEIDRKNPRTKEREIPAGVLSKTNVLVFVVISSLVFIGASYFINTFCFILSFPTLFILFFYSLTKRFTLFSHFFLGFAISLAPLGTWIAIKGEFAILPILFSAGLLFHISGFDILYAIQDADFDTKSKLHSIPAKLGVQNSFRIAALCHIISVVLFFIAGIEAELGNFYYIALVFAIILLLQEHKIANESATEILPSKFYWINSMISIILFIGILIDRWSEVIGKFQMMANI